MIGRGIDQILPHPGAPELREPMIASALEYVALAEEAHGRIPRRVDFAYVWGDALAELERAHPDARIVNLETSVTDSREWWPKGIHYALSPANVPCLVAARVGCCVLANNHVLDHGRSGLLETLEALERAGIAVAGAGRSLAQAQAPATLSAGGGRILILAAGEGSSGIPPEWAATPDRPGVNLLEDLSPHAVERIAQRVAAAKRPGDVVVASIHWGENWGYEVPRDQRAFAHALVDRAGVDIVHGHSSHHPKAIEVHAGRLILYGCGDFVNDYEGISGREAFRPDLTLMYLPVADGGGRLQRLTLVPFRVRKFRLERAGHEDAHWLCARLNRESAGFGARFELAGDATLRLR